MQKMPAQLFFVPPMECKEVKKVQDLPRGREWQYEIKWDGYRCLAIKQKGEVELFSRKGNVFSQFSNLYDVFAECRPKSFILDGEVVALAPDGKPTFNALQSARNKPIEVHFYAFDLLHLDGKSLINLPLEERQELLWEKFPKTDHLLHSRPLVGDLEDIIVRIEELALEGVVAKDKKSLYLPGKTPGTWIKKKLKQSEDFVIGGYVPAGDGVEKILVGKVTEGKLRFVADVDDGFVPATRRQVLAAIKPLRASQCPFANLPEKKGRTRWGGTRWDEEKMAGAVWVKPQVVVEIAMNEWTPDGRLRHAEFKRLKTPRQARKD